jgi:hypothetical protein
MKPFLQDSLQLGPLAAALTGMVLVRPLVIARVLLQVRGGCWRVAWGVQGGAGQEGGGRGGGGERGGGRVKGLVGGRCTATS